MPIVQAIDPAADPLCARGQMNRRTHGDATVESAARPLAKFAQQLERDVAAERKPDQRQGRARRHNPAMNSITAAASSDRPLW